MEIFRIESLDDFGNLKEEWNKLLSNSPASCIFLTWEWLFTWWEVYGNRGSLQILVAKEDGSCLGIAPLCLRTYRLLGFFPLRKLEFLGTGAVASDHLDFIVERGREQEVTKEFFEYCLRMNNWDGIELNDIRERSDIPDVVSQVFLGNGAETNESVAHICPFFGLPRSWDEYLQLLSWRTRKHLRHDTRVLMEKKGAKFVEWQNGSPFNLILDRLVQLHQERWISKERLGSFGTKRFRLFHERLIEKLANQGVVKFHLLEAENEIIAVFYSFLLNNTLFVYSTGFEKSWAEYGAGTVLLGQIVQDSIKNGISEVDLLRGQSSYKYNWTKTERTNKNITILRNRYKYLIVDWVDFWKEFLTRMAKKILPNKIYRKTQKVRDFLKLR